MNPALGGALAGLFSLLMNAEDTSDIYNDPIGLMSDNILASAMVFGGGIGIVARSTGVAGSLVAAFTTVANLATSGNKLALVFKDIINIKQRG